MNLKSLLQGFRSVAPTLSKVLAFIPGAQIPAAVLGILGETFLPDSANSSVSEEEIAQAIQKDPTAALKLRQIDSDERLATLANQLEQNKAAYAAQSSTQSWATTMEWFFGGVLIAAFALVFFIVATVMLTDVVITQDEKLLLTTVVGPLISISGGLIGAFVQLFRNKQ